jgi:TRAP-type C4-dicarboxylate transport system permease small subunit
MKWLRSAEAAARLVAALIVAALFAVLIAGVFARYALGHPLAWTDEVAAILFVWLVFWTGAFVLKTQEHVAFDIVYDLAPAPVRRVLGALGAACAAALLFWALPKIADYVAFLWRERTPVLQWRQDLLYACFPVFVAMAAMRLAATAFALIRAPAAAK